MVRRRLLASAVLVVACAAQAETTRTENATLVNDARALMDDYARDLLAGNREGIIARYHPDGSYLLGSGKKELLSVDAIRAHYSDWSPPTSFAWEDLSFEAVPPNAVAVAGRFRWGTSSEALQMSYTGLLVRVNGRLHIRLEDESGAPISVAGGGEIASHSKPVPLFNGKDLSGWETDVPAADSNVRLRSPFEVRNGMLVSLGEPRGHLVTKREYRNYRLDVEYRFSAAPGNAGVLVHASTPRALYKMFPRSIEVQMESGNAGDFWCILEDITVPNMEARRGPRAQWGTTEGKARRIKNLTDDSERPVGQWNRMVIEAVGRSIRVWVNGTLVNDGMDATADHGHIAVQSEGSEVEIRKLVLAPISALTPVK